MAQRVTADIPLSVIAGIGFALAALYTTIARRQKPTWTAGVVLLLSCAELAFARALQGLSPDIASKVFWYKMVHFGFSITPTAFLILTLHYGGLGNVLKPRVKVLLCIFPILSDVVIFTNEVHGWMWNPAHTVPIVTSMGFLSASEAGAWYWLFVAYSYVALGLGCFFLTRLLLHSRRIYGWQLSGVLLAAALAILGSALDVFKLSPFDPFVSTALGLAVGTIAVVFTLSFLRRRDMMSLSRTAIIGSIGDAIVVVDAEDRVADLNPAAERLIGVLNSQALGKPLGEMLPELLSERTRTGELTLRRGGEPRAFDVSVSSIRDWQRHTAGRVLVLHDITENKLALEEIGSQARFPAENPNPVLRVAGDGVLLYANPRSAPLLKTWNCSPGQTLPERWKEHARQALATGTVQHTEATCGETIYALTLAPIAEKGYVNVYGLDVTEGKRTDQLLRTLNAAALSMQRARSVDQILKIVSDSLGQVGLACAIFNTDDSRNGLRIKYLSYASPVVQAAERLVGRRTGGTSFPVDSIDVFRKAVRERQSVLVEDTESVIRRQLPEPYTHLARLLVQVLQVKKAALIPLVAEDEVIGLLTIQSNASLEGDLPTITAFAHQTAAAWRQAQLFEQARREVAARTLAEEQVRKLNEKLEQRVRERTEELQAANQELEAFAYTVSHDLRAPLRAIDGYTRILAEDYETALDANGQRVCQVICDETRRMGQLIDDLLTFSRFGRTEMLMMRIDMRRLVNSVFDELTSPADRGRIQFQTDHLPPAVGDPGLIRQVWINLLSNAIKFSSKRERALIEVHGSNQEQETVYSVSDNGAGFDPEYASKLFGVFQRLHSEKEFPGTGVGLAIVQRIVQRHGGRAWAQGAADQGATFHFALPRKEAQGEPDG